MLSDSQQSFEKKISEAKESMKFEDISQSNNSKINLMVASDEDIKESVRKINPDVNSLDRG